MDRTLPQGLEVMLMVLNPPQLPFWALVSFGSYLLFKLGWGVLTFNDVPDAHKELMREIDLAREDLRTKGIDVD
jgi:dolichyl-phosphate mannosyltransferase polypeptide 3